MDCMKLKKIDCFYNNGGSAFQLMAMGSFLTLLMQKLYGITNIGWLWVFMPLIIYGVLLIITGTLIALLLVMVHWGKRQGYGHDE